ncbi:MAG TPA: efflux RND transporter periplasmic adaptor subunit [Polyangiales bacterium]
MSKATVGWLLVFGLAGFGAYMYFKKPADKPVVHFESTKVDRGPIVAKVSASGTLSALVTVQVGSQVSGRLKQINVDFNSPVKKGEVIAKIDPQLFIAALEQARANNVAAEADLLKAKVQAADAQRQLTRAKGLSERKLIAQADLDTAQANADGAAAAVASAAGRVAQTEAALRQGQVNLAYSTIISPIDGMVISRNVDVGQTVAASLQAPVLFTIAENLHKMQVDTSVAEADIGKLYAGMQVTFTVDAYPSERFKGAVRQIRNAAQIVQNVVTYDAVIDVENPELKLRPGMTANVSFVYADKADVLRVPNAGLRFRPSSDLLKKVGASPDAGVTSAGNAARAGGRGAHADRPLNRRTLWLLKRGTPKSVEIKTGVTNGLVTEVLEGEVQVGDDVITDVTDPSAPSSGQSPPGMRRIL